MNAQKTSLLNQKQVFGNSSHPRQVEPVTSFRVSVRTPKLRLHKATGQAYAILNGKYIFFGLYGTPEAVESYHRTIAEWHANGRQPQAPATSEITIQELLARYWVYAEGYYRDAAGKPTTEMANIRFSLKPFCELYLSTKAVDFGPRAVKTVRQKMIELGWCRNNINKSIGRIKTMFKWATAEELIPGSVYQALVAVGGLKKGRCDARESEPVKPVPQEHVDAIQPYVSRQVWAMIQLQLLTAARPGEIIKMRPCDIDRTGTIWVYSPADHKTAHHGHQRKIYIGPKGQEVLQPFLLRPAEAYCFSPAEADAEHRIKKSQNRKTPLHQGNVPGSNCARRPIRAKGDVYRVTAYQGPSCGR